MSARRMSMVVLVALLVTAAALIPTAARLLQPVPQQVDVNSNGTHVLLSSGNARVAFDFSCMAAQWQISGTPLHALTLNDTAVPPVGSGIACGAPPRLDLTFTDGSTQEVALSREIVFTPEYRLLMLAALGLLLLLIWNGTGRRVRVALKARLPQRNLGFARLLRDAEAFVAAETPLYLWVLLVITAIGLALRLAFISMPIGLDEAVTYVRYASVPLADGLSNYSLPNNHLFHTLLVHLSTTLLGNAPWTLRLPALSAGVLMIPATYAAGRALYNRQAGLIAAGLVAAAWPVIEYSTNARGYTLLSLIFLLLIPLAVYLRKRRNPAGWILFALLAALGFYTIPIMLYPLGIVGLWLALSILIENRGAGRWLLLRDLVVATAAAGILTLLLYLPPILRSGLHAVLANQWVAPLTWAQFSSGFPGFLAGIRTDWVGHLPTWFMQLLAVGCTVGILLYRRIGRPRVPVAFVIVIWLPITLAIQRVLPFTRVMLFLLPLCAIIACAGLVWLIGWLPRPPRAALVIGCALVCAVWIGSISLKNAITPPGDVDMEPMVEYLHPQLHPGDWIAVIWVGANMQYYFRALDDNDHYFTTLAPGTGRVFLIANRAANQTAGSLFHYYQMNPANFDTPRKIASFAYFDIYIADQKPPANSAAAGLLCQSAQKVFHAGAVCG